MRILKGILIFTVYGALYVYGILLFIEMLKGNDDFLGSVIPIPQIIMFLSIVFSLFFLHVIYSIIIGNKHKKEYLKEIKSMFKKEKFNDD